MTKALDRLIEKGEKRVKLTAQLQRILARVAEDIAEALPDRAAIKVGKYYIIKKTYESNIGFYETLVIADANEFDPDYGPYGNAITDLAPAGEFRYLHGDFRCVVHVASRNEFIFFANNLVKIIEEFELKQDEVIESLKDALAKLSSFVSAEVEALRG